MNTLFKNAVILLPDYTTITGCVGVEGDKISFVGQTPEDFVPQRIVECDRNILMPALINTHTHLPMTQFRSIADDLPLNDWLFNKIFPLEAKYINDKTAYWFTLLACAELIRGGVSTVNDMYYCSNAIVNALSEARVRGFVSRCVVSGDGGSLERLAEARQLFERHGEKNGLINITVSMQGEYICNEGTFIRCRELARQQNAQLTIHCSETQKEHDECKQRHKGMSPVQYLHSLDMLENAMLVHCVWCDDDDIELIAKSKAHVSHCAKSNLKLGSGIASILDMVNSGINVTLGTDSQASNNSLNMFEEMRFCSLLQKGYLLDPTAIPAPLALDFATKNSAKALGINSGVLKSGAKADIIMLDRTSPDLNPLGNAASSIVYSCSSSNVLLNMVDGELLYDRGEFYTLDIENIQYECAKLCEEIDI